jgi:argininosuccinate synthase
LKRVRSIDRIVLACSGDLVTSVAIPWLAERYGAEVVTVTVDVGQGEALDDVRERALSAGAVRAHVIDARDEFARHFILPALGAGALDEEGEAVAVPLARLLVARHLVATAALEQAQAVAHGAGDAFAGEKLTRLIRSLNPRLRVLAPACDWKLTRPAQIAYARGSDIPVLEPAERPVTVSSNLWGRTARASLADANASLLATHLIRVVPAPATAALVALRFERGVPVAINDVEMPLVDLMSSLATIAGAHGIGRLELLTMSPGPERLAIEAPAAAVLRAASRELRAATSPAHARLAPDLAADYSDFITNGRWFTPEREALETLLTTTRDRMTGTVRLQIFKGACRVVDVDVPESVRPTAPADAGVPPAMSSERVAPVQA